MAGPETPNETTGPNSGSSIPAMATGTPVAAYPVDGPLEVLGRPGHGGSGSLGGAMHDDLRQACLAAMQVPRQEARQRAQDFSWSHASRLFMSFLVLARAVPIAAEVVTKPSSGL